MTKTINDFVIALEDSLYNSLNRASREYDAAITDCYYFIINGGTITDPMFERLVKEAIDFHYAYSELKDKVSLEDAFETKTAHIAGGNVMVNGTVKNEAIQALVALGYSSSEAMKAVSQVEISQEHKVEDVLKLALKHMAF